MPQFSLRKYYMDCHTDDGKIILCYASELALGYLKIIHSSLLINSHEAGSVSIQTFFHGSLPRISHDNLVKEAYRGEPQTGRHINLSDYQRLRAGFILLAFVFWNIPSGMIATTPIKWQAGSIIPGIITGVIFAFCMSTDFPRSNKRFSRLTS